VPKRYRTLLREKGSLAYAEGFYSARLQELQKLKKTGENPRLKRRVSREMGKPAKRFPSS